MQCSFKCSKDLKNSFKVIDIVSVKNIGILMRLKLMNHDMSDVG